MTGRDPRSSEWLRAEWARVTADAEQQVAEIRMPKGANRAERREVKAARRALWARRNAELAVATAATRGPSRAQRKAENQAAARIGEVALGIQRRKRERAARRATEALYRGEGQETAQ